MEIFWSLVMAYIAIGAALVGLTRSRGLGADSLFGLLWPVYLFLHFKRGY
ncbi:hypothetical protein [Roseibium sp.]